MSQSWDPCSQGTFQSPRPPNRPAFQPDAPGEQPAHQRLAQLLPCLKPALCLPRAPLAPPSPTPLLPVERPEEVCLCPIFQK